MVELRLTELFLDVVNRSISAGWLILLLVVLRPLLKQGLKWGLPLLWGMVGLRLLLPWSPESPLSLVPSRETLPPDILLSPAPAIHSGVPALNSALNPVITEAFQPNPAASFNPLQVWCFIAALIWLLGLALLMLYALLSTWLLRRRLRDAVLLRDRLYQSRRVSTPFVFGIFRPRIYLPFYMPEAALDYAAAHEGAHIRRRDHWWKPLGFLLLAFHWFNPLAWLAYSFLCRDIELACDEQVVRSLAPEARADYSQALLSYSTCWGVLDAYPLAFGESGVKERVRAVLRYRKPTFWTALAAVGLCIAVALCFLTNPLTPETPESQNSFWNSLGALNGALSSQPADGLPQLTLEELVLLSQKGEDLAWTDFQEYAHTDVGSGLYIWSLDIDQMFYVLVGGGSLEVPPMYIRLCARDGWNEDLDIREGRVTDYILRHKGNSVVIDCGYTWRTVSPLIPLPYALWTKMFAANEDKIYISSIQYLPAVRLDSQADLDSFLEKMNSYIQPLRGSIGDVGEAVIGYDGEFFEHQTLFAVYGEAAPDTLEIDYVQIREGVHLSIGVRVSNPETVIPKVGQLLFVAVPTQYLEGIIRYGAYVSSVE